MPAAARVAFIEACTATADRNTIRAAGLVTDPFGDPLEFRCTDPVRPDRLQKILWGGRLKSHLLVHVLAKPLYDTLSPPPDVVVVRQPHLLSLRDVIGVPVVQLLTGPDDAGCRLLVPPPQSTNGDDKPDPVYLKAAPGYPTDINTAMSLLARLAPGVSPFEPFARILQAMALIQQDETPVRAV